MNVLGMGPMEIVLIVVLALIVFGPAKLPEIMAQVGKAINDFRRATSELSDEFNRTIQAELKETRSVVDETRSVVTDAHTSVTSALSSVSAPTRTAAPAEIVPAANGKGTEGASNGAVPGSSTPPLADTSQWSWETAAPAASRPADARAGEGSLASPASSDAAAPEMPSTTTAHTTSAAEPATSGSSVGAGESTPSASPAAAPQTPRLPSAPARPAAKRASRDELLPPY